jgi:hypothetical protein
MMVGSSEDITKRKKLRNEIRMITKGRHYSRSNSNSRDRKSNHSALNSKKSRRKQDSCSRGSSRSISVGRKHSNGRDSRSRSRQHPRNGKSKSQKRIERSRAGRSLDNILSTPRHNNIQIGGGTFIPRDRGLSNSSSKSPIDRASSG